MVTTRAKRGTQYGNLDGQDEAEVQQAGINAVFAQLRDMGPQLLRLHQGLIGGLARSQEREAKRLAKEDDGDPLVAIAGARAERASALGVELAAGGVAVRRLVEGFSSGGMFHGYVMDPQGKPASGYVVEVRNASSCAGGRKALKAKTDDSGYFRIDFDAPARKRRKMEEVVETVVGAKDEAVKARAESDDKSEAQQAPPESYESTGIEVDISSPARKVVFRDPNPPSFDDPAAAVFRFYPLIDLKGTATR